MTLSVFCRFVAKPNSSAASVALIGSHRPKITAASAMKPAPAVISLLNAIPTPSVKYAPPMPAIAPASRHVPEPGRVHLDADGVGGLRVLADGAQTQAPAGAEQPERRRAATAMYIR